MFFNRRFCGDIAPRTSFPQDRSAGLALLKKINLKLLFLIALSYVEVRKLE